MNRLDVTGETMNLDKFTGLTCVPMVGELATIRSFVTYGCRVRVAPTTYGAYWGVLRPARGSERQPEPDEGFFWMDVEPGSYHNVALVHRDHLDAVDLLHAGEALAEVIRWLEIDRADEEKVLAALKAKDNPLRRLSWRLEPYTPNPTDEEKAQRRAAMRAVLDRLQAQKVSP